MARSFEWPPFDAPAPTGALGGVLYWRDATGQNWRVPPDRYGHFPSHRWVDQPPELREAYGALWQQVGGFYRRLVKFQAAMFHGRGIASADNPTDIH